MERKHLAWIGAAALALVVFAPLGLQVKKAAASDPAFCLSCHQMDGPYLAWANSPHADVTCVKCHPGDLATDLKHAWLGIVKQVETIEGEAVVDEQACVSCHVEGDHGDWPAVAATSGHRVHKGKTEDQCIGCHGSIEHVERPASEVCENCHGQELTLSGMVSQVHCLDCHNFLAEGDELTPDADGCRSCHTEGHASGARALESHGTQDCLACHGPHDPHPRDPVPCAECHDQTAVDHAPQQAACESCHLAHQAGTAASDQCVECHERPSHKGHLECVDCHGTHEATEPAEACADCHQVRKGLHGKQAHQQCLTCHRPHHATRPTEAECSACHADLLDTHASKGCVGCHTFRKDLPDNEG